MWRAASGNHENKDGVTMSAGEDCVVHFEDKGGDSRKISAVTLSTLLERREEWLTLPKPYGKFTEVARKSLEFIPKDTETIEDLGPLYYHVSCYRLFTDVEKLRRARKNAESTTDDQAEPSTSNDSRRRSARNGPISSTLSKRPKRDVLPTFCLICKVPGPIWITDKVLISKIYLKYRFLEWLIRFL